MKTHFSLQVDRSVLAAIPARARRKFGVVARKVAGDIEADAKAAIQTGPKTGRIYERGEHTVSFTTKEGAEVSFVAMRGKRSRTHQASAPGEAPASDTSALANSIRARRTGPTSAEVTVGARYGAALEFGTRKLSARPYLGPAVERNRAPFEAAVAAVVQGVAQGTQT